MPPKSSCRYGTLVLIIAFLSLTLVLYSPNGGGRIDAGALARVSEESEALLLDVLNPTRTTLPSAAGAEEGVRHSREANVEAPPLSWPPTPQWSSANTRPIPNLQKDDHMGNYTPLQGNEWDHSDVVLAESNTAMNAGGVSGGGGTNAPLTLSPDAKAIRIHYGILAVPILVYSRVLPLLNTSMRHADSVDVFLRKTNLSYAVAKYIREEVLKFHPNPTSVRVIELDGPDNEGIRKPQNIRNAWMDLEVMQFWGDELAVKEKQQGSGNGVGSTHTDAASVSAANDDDQWYCIIDDDGYAITANVKQMLATETSAHLKKIGFVRSDDAGNPNPKPIPPLIIGSTHVYRKKKVRRPFAVGGPGIYFNKLALTQTVANVLPQCLVRHVYGGGDIRASFCIVDAGATLISVDHAYFDSPMRAVGEAQKQRISPFPTGFHRMRERRWGFRLAAIEEKRHREGALVTWDDISTNFKEGSLFYYRSHFYPREFDNFTMIYFAMTKDSLALYNRKRKRPLDADPM